MIAKEIPPTAGMPLKFADFVFALSAKESCFEKELADFLEIEQLDIYSSGTLCLAIAFETAKRVSSRARVILPAYTCPLVAIAAHKAGMEIVLCDSKENSFCMDEERLEEICDNSVAAIVPTSIAGLAYDQSRVYEIAKANGAFIVADEAQSLGARVQGHLAGRNADFAVYSLAVGKGLSVYDGGLLAVKNPDLRMLSRKVASEWVKKDLALCLTRQLQTFGLLLAYNPFALTFVYGAGLRKNLAKKDYIEAVGDHFDFDIPAYEFDSFRKRVAGAALKRLPEFLRGNRARGLRRAEQLKNRVPALAVLAEENGSEGSWPFLMLLCKTERAREKIMSELWGAGLGLTRLFIHELGGYDYLSSIVPRTGTPNARSFAERSFSISNSPYLSDSDFEGLVGRISVLLS